MSARRDLIIEVIYAPLTGGSETLALTLCKQWKTEGVAARICCLHGREGELTRRFDAEGIDYDLLDAGDRSWFMRWFVIARYFARWRPRAIHAHHLGMVLNVIVPAYLTGCRRVVYTEHSSKKIAATAWMQLAAPVMSRLVTKVTCVSNKLSQYLREINVPPRKLATVYNGVDTSVFHPRDLGDSRAHRLRIGAVGRLVDEKDYPMMIEAIALLKSSGLDFEARIVGGGPLRPELEALSRKFGVEDVLTFCGPRGDIARILRTFDVYMLSSKNEGLPIAVLEAMATGLPIVATSVDAVPEVISHEDNGLLTPVGDARAFAHALERAARDPALRERLGGNALRDVRQLYSISQTTQLYGEYLGITQ